jgi:hypothetical protein
MTWWLLYVPPTVKVIRSVPWRQAELHSCLTSALDASCRSAATAGRVTGWTVAWVGPDRLEKKVSFVLALIRILDCPARSPVDLPSSYAAPTTVYNIQQFCIYVFCVDLRTNSDYFHIQNWLAGFYDRDIVCLLRGTDCIFSYNLLIESQLSDCLNKSVV